MAWWLLACVLCVYLATNRGAVWSSDAAMRIGMAEYLLDTGKVGIPEDLRPHLKDHGGKLVWGLGHPVVLIPSVLAGRLVGVLAELTGHDGPAFADITTEACATLTNALLGALTCVVLFALGRRLGYSQRTCVLAAAALGFATVWWPYTQDAFYETQQGLCLLTAWLVVAIWMREQALPMALLAGALIGFATLTKLTNVLYALPLLGLLVTHHRTIEPCHPEKSSNETSRRRTRQLAAVGVFLLGMAPFLVAQAWSDWSRYGVAFPSVEQRHPQYAGALAHGHVIPGLWSLFAGLEQGLLWYTPAILIALAGFVGLWRRDRQMAASLLLAVGLGLLTTARVTNVGLRGVCWGPRYLVPLMPLAAAGFLGLFEAARRRPRLRVLVVGTIVLSAGIQLLGTSVHYYRYYQERSELSGDIASRLPFSFPLARQAAYLGQIVSGRGQDQPPEPIWALGVLNYWWALACHQGVPAVALAVLLLALMCVAGYSGLRLRALTARAAPPEGPGTVLDEQ